MARVAPQCAGRVSVKRSPLPSAHPRAHASAPPLNANRRIHRHQRGGWAGGKRGGENGAVASATFACIIYLTHPPSSPQSPATRSPYSKNLPRSIRARLAAAERRAAAARAAADAAPPPPPDTYDGLPATHRATASRRGGGRSAMGPWPGTQFETPTGEVEAAQRAALAAARAADAAAVADRAAANAVAAAVPPPKMPQERRVARDLRANRVLQQPAQR